VPSKLLRTSRLDLEAELQPFFFEKSIIIKKILNHKFLVHIVHILDLNDASLHLQKIINKRG
jgi:hypothetical protein